MSKKENKGKKCLPSHEPDVPVDFPLILERKVPVKIDPKGYFAVERTFLAWMVCSQCFALCLLHFHETNWQTLHLSPPAFVTLVVWSIFHYHWIFMGG